MSILLTNATLLELSGSRVERADLRIKQGVIVERARRLKPKAGEPVSDLSGKYLMPGMVCGHTHLYSALARGMPAPKRTPRNFYEILKYVWWTLDRALDEEAVYYSALVGALDAARAGTTTLIDHHASPNFIRGSLDVMKDAFLEVGLRGVFCYEVTDRNGMQGAKDGLDENRDWVTRNNGPMFAGLVGAHASFTLSDRSLLACAELAKELQSGVHIHVAEDPCDQEKCKQRLIDRLADAGVLGTKTILGHCTHLDRASLDKAKRAGCWFAHNPRSNMNNAVGYAPVHWMGVRVALGTDGIGADMFEEVKFAWFKARDGRNGLGIGDVAGFLVGAQQLASMLLGVKLGKLEVGAGADLAVLSYPTPTAITSQNLFGHLIFGMSSQFVTDTMVNGQWIVRDRKVVGVDEEAVREKSQKIADSEFGRRSRGSSRYSRR
jgi:putative selenium metabolism protein SsnA